MAERALTITEAALPSDHTEVGERHDELGRVLRDLGDLAGARRELERAVAIDEAVYGPDHPGVATDRSNFGGLYLISLTARSTGWDAFQDRRHRLASRCPRHVPESPFARPIRPSTTDTNPAGNGSLRPRP